MTPTIMKRVSRSVLACYGDFEATLAHRSSDEQIESKTRRVLFLLFISVVMAGLSLTARPQSAVDYADPSAPLVSPAAGQLDLTYVRPTQRIMFSNYMFDSFGPYPITGAAIVAGIGQFSNAPPEWGQGMAGYGRRFGSDYGIAWVATTTRYGLSQAFKEDAMYYRCECRGFIPRLSHATLSTFTARKGDDGHRTFSFPALAGPYAGSMAAVYAWYP
ncbi:MAG: hypothetical protein ABR907_08985, partial [Terracidiphilus sp.]